MVEASIYRFNTSGTARTNSSFRSPPKLFCGASKLTYSFGYKAQDHNRVPTGQVYVEAQPQPNRHASGERKYLIAGAALITLPAAYTAGRLCALHDMRVWSELQMPAIQVAAVAKISRLKAH